mmetsp:Transcript_33942/g.73352  ORF Transcript_33942/g.73352 Transcript_33942/m.73352 type:complete len:215 (+) Transcript_33942:27-671(+)
MSHRLFIGDVAHGQFGGSLGPLCESRIRLVSELNQSRFSRIHCGDWQLALRFLIGLDPLGRSAVHHVIAGQQRSSAVDPGSLEHAVCKQLTVLLGKGQPFRMLRLQILLKIGEEMVRVVTSLWRLVIFRAPASVQGGLASSRDPPTIESWQEMMTTSMRGVLVRSVTFGAAARADSAATFDQSPNLSLLKLQCSLQLLSHPIFHRLLPKKSSQL